MSSVPSHPGGTWARTWLWEQTEDHPQRLLAQPRWRQRQWLKRKTPRDAQLADMLLSAPARLVYAFIGGLKKRPTL